ncbi:MAG: photosystem II stability/assembly factor-like uncharacterized protein [Parvicellaceae bacterium]|jgi:photosystem II stability/assembly factor-like uncharacterized protein
MRIFLIVVLSLSISSLFGQEWVDQMKDPNVNFYEVQQSFNDFWGNRTIERGKGYKQYKRWEYFMEPRVHPHGNRPNPTATFVERLKFESEYPQKEAKAGTWTPLGPSEWTNPTGWNPGVGRINCVAEEPGNSSTIYVGSPAGGIWKSIDSGISWTPLADDFISMGVSSIVISAQNTNTIYIATGDSDGSDTYSIGVLKSTDGGLTWNTTGLSYLTTESKSIYKLLIHPTNDQMLWAATDNGFYKSIDGGNNWVQKSNYAIRDIELNPDNPNTIFASARSVFYSHDAGETFASASGLPSTSLVSRMVIAVTEHDSNYVYALAANDINNGLLGVYQSIDGGATYNLKFDTLNLLGYSEDGDDTGGQSWYDLAIACSHTNKNRIIVGGINAWRSNDGGDFFTIVSHWVHPSSIGYTHADIHTLDYIGSRLYCGSDGGIFRSFNSGTTWSDLSAGLEIGQFYKLGITEQNPDLIIGGLQDNGTFIKKSTGWEHIRGGDGMEAIIDPTNDSVWYTSYQYGSLNKTVDGGANFFGISDSITEGGAWVTPYAINPVNTDILYAGYGSIWKTTDGGLDWEKVSPYLFTVRHIEVSSSNPDVVYVSSYDDIYRTTDAGATWNDVTSNLPSGPSISGFTISPTNSEVVFITYSSYFSGDKVFVTSDGGATWSNISGNLPNIPINCIEYETGSAAGIYIGTDNGIYYKDSNLIYWQTFDGGLPNVIINELAINSTEGTIKAATYGRGIWESPLKAPLGVPIAGFVTNLTEVCPGQTIQYTDQCIDHGPFWQWTFPGGIPSTSTDQNPLVTYPILGDYDAKLVVSNVTGSDSITKTLHISVVDPVVGSLDLIEDFEAGWDSEWVVNNLDFGTTWEIVPYGGYGLSDSCVSIDNYRQESLSNDEFFTNAFDASAETEVWLQFDYAYGKNSGYKKDTLAIFTTTNCGGLVTEVWKEGGSNLATVAGLFTGPFAPLEIYWSKVTMDISHLAGESSSKVLFRNIGRQGNLLYIDNINITNYPPATGVMVTETPIVTVYPNPSNSVFYVDGLPANSVYEVYDLSGRMLIESGNSSFDLERYASGIYVLKLNVGGTPQSIKLIKE